MVTSFATCEKLGIKFVEQSVRLVSSIVRSEVLRDDTDLGV